MVQSPRSQAALQALLVVFIWSTSFILAKWAFRYGFRPLTLSGVRFALAALLLTPLGLCARRRSSLVERGSPGLGIGLALGLAGYAVNTGGYNFGLFYLIPAEVALLLALNNTLQVLIWGWLLLKEIPGRLQLAATGVGVGGLILFYSSHLPTRHLGAVFAVLAAGVGYALWIVGNRRFVGARGALDLTWQSMSWGAVILLVAGIVVDGLPRVAALGWLIVVVLAALNTAFAFVLWGHTQKVLTSYESAVINNTQTVQVALLSLILLGEPLNVRRWIAIVIVTVATIIVHIARPRNMRLTRDCEGGQPERRA
jgi:drug/metabolite transporter (DMT)-like permease